MTKLSNILNHLEHDGRITTAESVAIWTACKVSIGTVDFQEAGGDFAVDGLEKLFEEIRVSV